MLVRATVFFFIMINQILFYDLETTGLSLTKNEIIEFGGLLFNAQGVEEISFLLRPSKPVPAHIKRITGISEKDYLTDLVLTRKQFKLFLDAISVKNTLLIGHNILRFDNKFLRAAGATPRGQFYDTMVQDRSRRSLSKLTKTRISHRALADVKLCFQVYAQQTKFSKYLLLKHAKQSRTRLVLPQPIVNQMITYCKTVKQ